MLKRTDDQGTARASLSTYRPAGGDLCYEQLMSEKDQVAKGKVVTLLYRLTNEDGKLLDDSGDEGMEYLHGADNIVPGLEKKITGHVVGDKLSVVVTPEEGYGRRVGSPQKVPRDSFPDDVELEVGMQFMADGADGEELPVCVVAVTETE